MRNPHASLSFRLAAVACLGASVGPSHATAQPAAPKVPLRAPTAAALAKAGPDSFTVVVSTSKGPFTIVVRRAWSPKGADRFFHLVQARYLDGIKFYRAIPGFMAQAGYHGDPAITAAWDAFPLPDEPVKHSNTRGAVTFATTGRNSRTTQFFVNIGNNANLDALAFTPFGEVTDGMPTVDMLYSGYGEGFPRGDGPDQRRIRDNGNAYLKQAFPKLDGIDSARVGAAWPPTASSSAGESAKPPRAKKPPA
jgi:peptidyl-prolyl cis-trans isomerase A (cyclophilin A)